MIAIKRGMEDNFKMLAKTFYGMEELLAEELKDLIEEGRVKVIKIPDIESINYGRGVGYEVIEHVPPKDIHDISATKIRNQMKEDGKL